MGRAEQREGVDRRARLGCSVLDEKGRDVGVQRPWDVDGPWGAGEGRGLGWVVPGTLTALRAARGHHVPRVRQLAEGGGDVEGLGTRWCRVKRRRGICEAWQLPKCLLRAPPVSPALHPGRAGTTEAGARQSPMSPGTRTCYCKAPASSGCSSLAAALIDLEEEPGWGRREG